MVKAILAGTKTQTRRVLQPQPHDLPAGDVYCDPYNHNYEHFTFWTRPDNLMCLGVGGNIKDTCHWRCPYGVPGDRLYVKEAFLPNVMGCPNGLAYKADHLDPKGDGPANPMRWKSGRFMPRWAARLFLVVTDVRVERLDKTTPDDLRAEGFDKHIDDASLSWYRRFADYWNSLNRRRGYSWESRPWVGAISFRRVEDA